MKLAEYLRKRRMRLQKQAFGLGDLRALGTQAAEWGGTIMKNPLGRSVVGGLGMVAMDFLGDKLKEVSLENRQQKAFQTAMNLNPDLKRQDPMRVQMAFDTVKQFAPNVAANPALLSTYMNRTGAFGNMPVEASDIKQLAELEHSLGRGGGMGTLGKAYGRLQEQSIDSVFSPLFGGPEKEGPNKLQRRAQQRAQANLRDSFGKISSCLEDDPIKDILRNMERSKETW